MSAIDQSLNETIATGCLRHCRESPGQSFKSPSANYFPNYDRQLVPRADQQKKQELDTMLSEALKNLSFEERQVQQEELHGVADDIVEDPSFVEDSLKELESFLLRTKTGRVYETAESQDPEYVNSRDLRISFLRGDKYNVKAAADRMLRFFDEKQKLFGTEKLTKDITIDDLDQDDIAALKSGSVQWAGTDRSRRPIILHLPGLRQNFKLKSELRAHYMILMEGLRSSETQLRGVVILVFAVGHFKDREEEGSRYIKHTRLASSIPLNLGAFHKACDDIKQYLVGRATIAMMRTHIRTRVRIHFGSPLECQYRLASYGIPAEVLPLFPETNAVDMEPHLRWCQNYILKGHSDAIKNDSIPSSTIEAITEPNQNDVISAGTMRSDNIGNERLRVLVRESLEAYRSSSNAEKSLIVDRIISEIHSAGGRFLKKEKGSQTWYELPLSKTRLQITQRFRNLYRQRESASQQAWEGTLIADSPLPNDVILGRAIHRNRGTSSFHLLIKDRSEEYEAANRNTKWIVADSIIERIQMEGGRFLQPSQAHLGRFAELSSKDSIRNRISTYFRNYRRTSKTTVTASGL